MCDAISKWTLFIFSTCLLSASGSLSACVVLAVQTRTRTYEHEHARSHTQRVRQGGFNGITWVLHRPWQILRQGQSHCQRIKNAIYDDRKLDVPIGFQLALNSSNITPINAIEGVSIRILSFRDVYHGDQDVSEITINGSITSQNYYYSPWKRRHDLVVISAWKLNRPAKEWRDFTAVSDHQTTWRGNFLDLVNSPPPVAKWCW